MKKLLRKPSFKAGLSPGTLVHIGEQLLENVTISIVEYDANTIFQKDNITIEEALHFLETPTLTWLNICGVHDVETIQRIGTYFKLHPLIQEDIVNTTQRAKLDDFQDAIFIVLRSLHISEHQIDDEQVSIILGKNYVISFLESNPNLFDPIRQRMQNSSSRLRIFGSDYLCYTILDFIIDQYFGILENVDQELELLDNELIRKPNTNTLMHIQLMKRELALIRKAIWPLREVISKLSRSENPLITQTTKIYLGDVYDHVIQTIDAIENYREISSSQLDLYMSSISQRLNEIMKVLTIMSTIFVPMTFIASFYGMNFVHMPELKWQYGYLYALGLMALMAGCMLFYFWKKGWILGKLHKDV